MIIEYAEKVLKGGEITRNEAIELINVPDQDTMLLLAMADRIRQRFNGDEVDVCAIVNARSGRCPENCKFCAQSVHHNTGVQEYPLLSADELVSAAKKAKDAGAVRFSIVTSGRGQSKADDFENILEALRKIREEVGIEVCTSLGILTLEQALELKAAGVTRYHANIETAPSHFPDVCSTHTYEDKMSTIQAAKDAGIRVCSGGILGLNETPEQRVEMAFELKRLQIDSVPLNLLNQIPGTPFADNKSLTALEILRAFAVFRFILPRALIRTAGGREVNLRDLQALALNGGMNGIMVGGYLTTGGRRPEDDKVMLEDLGRPATKAQI
ncbi:MAG: biotin synthase BioB [Acholeplasmataceae bacterium]|nr:biotin synthase BioB [Acidaminococcaceae bacterium]NLY83114.1 biotin synthase BioB [Acholeplasmataceae bacterium]